MTSKITLRSWVWDKKVIRAEYLWVDFDKNGHFVSKVPLEIRKVEKNWNENHIDIVPSFFWEILRKHTYLMAIFILPKFTKSDTDVVKFCFNSCGYQKHTYLMLIFQKVNDSRGKKSAKDRQRNWDCKIEFYTCFFQIFSGKK